MEWVDARKAVWLCRSLVLNLRKLECIYRCIEWLEGVRIMRHAGLPQGDISLRFSHFLGDN